MGQTASGLITVSRSNTNGGGTNNLPSLLFHTVHGENIRINGDRTEARRAESFCKGIVFSSRPVKVNEKICVKLVEVANNWSGVIRFGFTINDPSGLRYSLPKYACPDLTNKPGYWAKALPERYCSENIILFYYVTSAGDVHFGINGEEKGVFFNGVDTRGPLWALLDVYGNSTVVKFVDSRQQLNNSRRSLSNVSCNNTNLDEVDRIIFPMQQIQLQQRENDDMQFPFLRYQSSHVNYHPMTLHRTRGRNVIFNSNRTVAWRTDSEFCQGYVFTGRPLQIGERCVVQILSKEPMFEGCLGLGFTSCDPSTLRSADLPDDSNCLLDRPEYWVVYRDFVSNLNKGDEISFYISFHGQVQISRNGGPPLATVHVDQSLKLWALFDIYGSTQKIRIFSSPSGMTSPNRNHEQRVLSPTSIESANNLNSQSEMRSLVIPTQSSTSRYYCIPQSPDIQIQPSANGRAVLSVILPPTRANQPMAINNHSRHISGHSSSNHSSYPSQLSICYGGVTNQMPSMVTSSTNNNCIAPVPLTSNLPVGTISSCSSNTYVDPISESSTNSSLSGWIEPNGTTFGAGTECTICYENPIDAVLYTCGHMCMCYKCARQQWHGEGGGQCPLCRAVIIDVIRTYKS